MGLFHFIPIYKTILLDVVISAPFQLFEHLLNHLQGTLVPPNIEINHQIRIIPSEQEVVLSEKYEPFIQLGGVPYLSKYTWN
jgi:hypothetical protein